MTLLRRLERLEAMMGGGEVGLEELILWSYEREPFDAGTQRRYEDFTRRCEGSRLCRLINEAYQRFIGTVDPPQALGYQPH